MTLAEVALSNYGRASTEPSPVNRMMGDFAATFRDGLDINLGVGYVNERTIPREQVREALGVVLDEPHKHRAALNYGGPRGSANLIDAVRRFLVEGPAAMPAGALDGRQIIVGPNGATGLLESIACLVRRGMVVAADPMYYIYCDHLARLGFEVLAVPEDEQGLSVAALTRRLETLGERRRELSFLYVVTVHNPTGTVLSNPRRRQLLDVANRLSAELGRKVPLILDRAYEELIHDPAVEPVESVFPLDESGIVYEVGTLSKILAPGLRIGYMVAPPGPFLDALIQRTSDAGFSAPLLNQEIASCLLDRHAADQVSRVKAGYRDKARHVQAWLQQKLGDGVERCSGGQAGFYFYLTLRGVATHVGSDFFRYLSRTTGDPEIDGPAGDPKARVIYIPGDFCVHPAGELVDAGKRQLRISYGFEELEQIERALDLMAQAMHHAGERGA